MTGDLNQQAENQDKHLPRTTPGNKARPLDKPPPAPATVDKPDHSKPGAGPTS